MGTVIAASLLVLVLLLIVVQVQQQRIRTGRWWLTLALVFALLSAVAYYAPTLSGFWMVLAQAALIVVYGVLAIRDLNQRFFGAWLIGGSAWLAGMILAAAFGNAAIIGTPEWILNNLSAPSALTLITFIGLLIAGLSLIVTEFYAFYAASLSEVANRALFWVMDTALLLMSTILIISGTDVLHVIGLGGELIALSGAIYAQVSFSVFDVRSQLMAGARTLLVVLLTAVVIFAALYAAALLEAPGTVALALVALVAALVSIPLSRLVEAGIDRMGRGSFISPTEITRRYSQQIAGKLELSALIDASTRAINQWMRVRRSALILVSESDVTALLELQSAGAETKRGLLSKAGRLYVELAREEKCLSQFDLEFNPLYRPVPESERAFFHDLQMSAYAPILADDVLIGILACGAKRSDAPITPRDLELLALLAHQTGTALRNARLVADLRYLNEDMTRLNESLENAKAQMEQLDAVKTDFITIASHELRTPLAQIVGYADILDTLNEQAMLSPEETSGIVSSLRRASERMEELISAMLDVSQLDINAMNLRFAETSLEGAMRMAIEPLTDAIRQRSLTLTARGLRGLPAIQADLQRLVQAFRNVIVNAVKYTPDGGRIEIKATIEADDEDFVLITIHDTGVGIDKKNLELIFQKFYRAFDPNLHSTGTYKFMGAGPGLGLTIAQGVIEGHGGKIWAESEGFDLAALPGTTFYIKLPIQRPEAASLAPPKNIPDPLSDVPTRIRLRQRSDVGIQP